MLPFAPMTPNIQMTTPQASFGQPSFGDRLSGMLFPTLPGQDPAAAAAAQRQAMLMMGFGMMAGARRPGATLGSSLFDAYRGASGTYQGAMDTAFRNTLAKSENERQHRAEEREIKRAAQEEKQLARAERAQAGDVAGRLAAGIRGASANPAAYWSMMRGNPDVQATLQQFGLQEPQTPEDVMFLGEQLAGVGQVSGPRMTPRDIELKAIVGPDGKQMLVPEAAAVGREPGYAPVTPPSLQLTTMDLPGGMKQNVQWNPRTGKPEPIGEPFKEPSQSKPTEGNLSASGYYSRMANSEQQIGTYVAPWHEYAAFEKVLSGNAVVAAAANKLLSPESQVTFQAQADWVRAKLRKESGASIPPAEMIQEIRTYFALPGDSPEVVAQKARARQVAMEAMATSAGPALSREPPAQQSSRMPAEIYSPDAPEAVEAEMRRRGLLK
jgi:hypothetical protein